MQAKKMRNLLVISTIVVWILSFCTSAQNCARKYQIKSGDTCWKLQNDNHISNESFMAMNPGIKCDKLQIGQTVCLSTKPSSNGGASGSTKEPGRTSATKRATAGNCVRTYKTKSGDTCWKLQTDNKISKEAFEAMNPRIDCDKLQVDQTVCLSTNPSTAKTGATPRPGTTKPSTYKTAATDKPVVTRKPDSSTRSVTQQNRNPSTTKGIGSTAQSVQQSNVTVVESVISENCTDTYVAKDNDTCSKIQTENRISKEALILMNPGLDCDKLQSDRIICISTDSPTTVTRSSTKRPGTGATTQKTKAEKCTKTYKIIAGDTCWDLQIKNNMSNETFMSINPGVNCDSLQIDQKICLSTSAEDDALKNGNCTKWHRIVNGDTCWNVWTQNQLEEKEFYAMNPLAQCDRLRPGDRLCIADNKFASKQCFLTYTIKKDESCDSIAKKAKLTVNQLQEMNKNLNCSNVKAGRIICLRRTDAFAQFSEENSTSAKTFLRAGAEAVLKFNLADEASKKTLNEYLKTGANAKKAGDIVLEIFAKPKSLDALKELTKNNNVYRQIQETFLSNQRIVCEQLTIESEYKKCICNDSALVVHCQALLAEKVKPLVNVNSTVATNRTKRSSDTNPFHSSEFISDLRKMATALKSTSQGKRIKRASKSRNVEKIAESFKSFQSFINTICSFCFDESMCFGASGCFPIPIIPFLEFCAHAEVCFPSPVSLLQSDGRITLNQFMDGNVKIGAGICITGINEILQVIGMDLCLANLEFTYYYLRQQLDITPSISFLGLVKGSINVRMQTADSLSENIYDSDNDVVIGDLCEEEEHGCRDYCLLQDGNVIASYKVEVNIFVTWITVEDGNINDMPPCERNEKPPVPVDSKLERLVLYTTGWAQYRASDGLVNNVTVKRPKSCKEYAQTPKDIPRNIATHINYAFLVIDKNTFELINFEKNDDELVGQMVDLKDGSTKVLVSVGGWSFSQGEVPSLGLESKEIFPKMASSAQNRERFVTSVIRYINKFNLDGVDIDWEYPGEKDKENFSSLMKELRAALDATGKQLLLTYAAPAGEKNYKNIDLKTVSEYSDFVNLMSYDFHGGSFDTKVKPQVNAPIVDCTCPDIGDILMAVNAYLEAGVEAKKITLGLATYGRTFKLDSSGNSVGPAEQGECTLTPGVLSYYEIVDKKVEPEYDNFLMALYAKYGDDEWVGYDNERSHESKMCFARSKRLGGVMVWDAELDKKYTLLKNIKDKLEADCGEYKTPKCGEDGKSRKKRAPKPPSKGKDKGKKNNFCTAPRIIHGDESKLKSCDKKEIGKVCMIHCEKGYTPEPKTIKCERSGFGRTRKGKWSQKAKCTSSNTTECGSGPFPLILVYSTKAPTSSQKLLPPYYAVKFNTNNGVPIHSMYAQRSSTQDLPKLKTFLKHECFQDKQIDKATTSNDWHRGHLTPDNAFKFGGKISQTTTMVMINIASQDGPTNSGPWKALEDRVLNFGADFPGIVITGTCPGVTRDTKTSAGKKLKFVIPDCFWKIYCTKMSNGNVTISAYYHENKKSSNTASRKEEVYTLRSKQFITSKFHTSTTWASIWLDAANLKSQAVNSTIPLPTQCLNASFASGNQTLSRGFKEDDGLKKDATPEEFWREMLKSKRYEKDSGDGGDDLEVGSDDEEDDGGDDGGEDGDDEDGGNRIQPYEHCGKKISR